MLRFLILSCLVVCALGCSPKPIGMDVPHKIVGGERAYVEDYPHQLALYRNKEYSCVASIVSSTMAITAARCTHGATAQDLSVRSGSNEIFSGGTMHNVTRIHQHPDFNNQTLYADISLLEVNPPFRFSRYVKPIDLPDRYSDLAVGTSVNVSGWGTSSLKDERPVNLRHVVVQVADLRKCILSYGFVRDNIICVRAPEEDTCLGEYGGPFAQNGKLYGIASFSAPCLHALFPDIYTRVASFHDWILRTLEHEDLDGNESAF